MNSSMLNSLLLRLAVLAIISVAWITPLCAQPRFLEERSVELHALIQQLEERQKVLGKWSPGAKKNECLSLARSIVFPPSLVETLVVPAKSSPVKFINRKAQRIDLRFVSAHGGSALNTLLGDQASILTEAIPLSDNNILLRPKSYRLKIGGCIMSWNLNGFIRSYEGEPTLIASETELLLRKKGANNKAAKSTFFKVKGLELPSYFQAILSITDFSLSSVVSSKGQTFWQREPKDSDSQDGTIHTISMSNN